MVRLLPLKCPWPVRPQSHVACGERRGVTGGQDGRVPAPLAEELWLDKAAAPGKLWVTTMGWWEGVALEEVTAYFTRACTRVHACTHNHVQYMHSPTRAHRHMRGYGGSHGHRLVRPVKQALWGTGSGSLTAGQMGWKGHGASGGLRDGLDGKWAPLHLKRALSGGGRRRGLCSPVLSRAPWGCTSGKVSTL